MLIILHEYIHICNESAIGWGYPCKGEVRFLIILLHKAKKDIGEILLSTDAGREQ